MQVNDANDLQQIRSAHGFFNLWSFFIHLIGFMEIPAHCLYENPPRKVVKIVLILKC